MGSEVGDGVKTKPPPAKQKHKAKQKSRAGLNEAKAELLLPGCTRFVALLSLRFCSFRRPPDRARSARRGAAVLRRFNPSLLPCGDVTPLLLAPSAAGGTGTTGRGRSRSGALLRAAAPPQRRQRLRLAGHGCARFVAFTQLKSQCSYFFVAIRSNSFLPQTRKRGETPRARLNRTKWQKQQMIRSPTH